MQEACQARLPQAGMAQYEVSAYAHPGAECAHNLNYWRFGDYLGIGAGAHAKLSDAATGTIRRRWKLRAPRGYLEYAGTARVIGGDDVIAPEQLPFEFMLNGLRLNVGFPLADFTARTGIALADIEPALDHAIARGWIQVEREQVRASELGQRFLNDVISSFLPTSRLTGSGSIPALVHGGPPHD